VLHIVQGWSVVHKEERMTNWQRGVDLLPIQLVSGADVLELAPWALCEALNRDGLLVRGAEAA
jgi:hypothetical protein